MRTAMVPIIKNVTGGTSDKHNYIALVTPASYLRWVFSMFWKLTF